MAIIIITDYQLPNVPAAIVIVVIVVVVAFDHYLLIKL